MTARLVLRRPPPKRSRRWSPLLWLEYLFLFAGLLALDAFIWTEAGTALQQAYDSWSLDRTIQNQPTGMREFLAAELHWPWLAEETAATVESRPAGTAPAPAVEDKGKTAEPEKRKRLPEFALIGRIEVPRLGLKATVREGVGARTLGTSVGHMPSTPLPGELGNTALAAHRDTLFRKLRGIRKNDKIAFQTPEGRYEYIVESLSIVKPANLSVLDASKNDRILTLITCYPFNFIGSAPNRFIVRARQLETDARRTQGPPSPTGS